MVFSSLLFIFLFMPLTILLYYISPKPWRNLILLIASLIFYAWGEPVYIGIMIFSTVFDYANGILIDKYRERKGAARAIIIGSIIVNLGILCFFKYYGFFVDNINGLFNLNIQRMNLPLPVGISFYTFQTMSYTIDVYLGNVPVQKNIINFGTFVTMFPQLVAGPIVKYGDIQKQLDNRRESLGMFGEGVEVFISGLAKKVLLANNIGILWSQIKAMPVQELSVVSAWIGIIAFTFQIYFDFSGYSDMAIGLGKMFGFDLMKNFDYPYTSKSVTEFWRRWHISLGSWFREYVYIPLGGNRCKISKQLRNLFVVWFLTGFWHGANWNFILWGLYYGTILTIEKFLLKDWLKKIPGFFTHLYTMVIVIIGWVFFECESITQGMKFIKVMFGLGGNAFVDRASVYYIYTNILLFVVLIICSTPILKRAVSRIRERMKMAGSMIVPVMYFILIFLSTAYLVNESYNPFLYFRF